jgi:hypothetical protein
VLAAWNNWNTVIPSFVLKCGIIFHVQVEAEFVKLIFLMSFVGSDKLEVW